MHLKLLIVLTLSVLSIVGYAQVVAYENQFDEQTYIVRWIPDPAPQDPLVLDALKDDYLIDFRSEILCEMNFGGRQYAWLKFLSPDFPQTLGGVNYPTINGGVIGATTDPAVDGSSLDFIAEHESVETMPMSSCLGDFDLTIPFGSHPVCVYNLDTGVEMPMIDSNTPEQDFDGSVTCIDVLTMNPSICEDKNGHGTHGAGIQLSLFNKSYDTYGFPSTVNLVSYAVFDSTGSGNLGAILCALSDIVSHPAKRKVVNCSFSFVREPLAAITFDPLLEAFTAMGYENIFSVMAAGNDATFINPPSYEVYPMGYFSNGQGPDYSTISVGGANCDYTFASHYSNFSRNEVDVVTLGILPGPNIGSVPGIDYYEGTSQATFATSAVAAMLLSHQDNIELDKLKCSMIQSSVYDPSYTDKNRGTGILSASTALLQWQHGCEIEQPCPEVAIIGGDIPDNTYNASEALYSNGFMQSNEVIFKAGKEVTLLAGFSARPEIQFHILIEACN